MTKLASVILGVSVMLVSQGAWAKCEHIQDKSSKEYKDCMAKPTGKKAKPTCISESSVQDKNLPSTGSGKGKTPSSSSTVIEAD